MTGSSTYYCSKISAEVWRCDVFRINPLVRSCQGGRTRTAAPALHAPGENGNIRRGVPHDGSIRTGIGKDRDSARKGTGAASKRKTRPTRNDAKGNHSHPLFPAPSSNSRPRCLRFHIKRRSETDEAIVRRRKQQQQQQQHPAAQNKRKVGGTTIGLTRAVIGLARAAPTSGPGQREEERFPTEEQNQSRIQHPPASRSPQLCNSMPRSLHQFSSQRIHPFHPP